MLRTLPLALVALVLGAPGVAAPASGAKPKAKAIPGELIVGFKEGVSDADRRQLLRRVGGAEKRRFVRIRGALVGVSPSRRDAVLAELRADPLVRYAEPNYVLETTAVPNDPLYNRLWGLSNTGQFVNGWPGTPDADADVDAAWSVTTGDPGVVVAVIDTGVDQAHPDLAANTWVNPGENCAGCRTDGVDNDGNGYVDDWRGWDFVNGDNNPADDQGHGTHVAGTIGAVGDNGVGVVGVNWNVRLMGLKFLGSDGSGTTADAVSAILYAAANGADVLNNSWAGGDFSQSLLEAIQFADARDSLFVAAAGNDGMDNDAAPTYPASYDVPNVLAVAASDSNDRHAFFSNFGKQSVDVSAPGVNIYSTWPGGSYQYASGTSMAAPHAAGIAALVEAAQPGASDVGVKTLLLRTADPIAALASMSASGGRLNAASAVSCAGRPLVWVDAPSPDFTLETGEDLAISLSASACADPAGAHVSANVNGVPVTLLAQGDGHYTGTYTPASAGSLELTVTATAGGATDTRSVQGSVRQVFPIVAGGAPVTVSTTAPGQDVQLEFEGDAGDRVALQLRDVTLAQSTVTIYEPDGTRLGAEAFVGKFGLFVDPRTLPESGTYTMIVDPYRDAVGAMTLELYDVPPDPEAAIAPGGSPVTLTTTSPGQNARATFSAPAGARVSVRLSGVTIKSAKVALLKGSTSLGSTIVGTAGGFLDVEALPGAGDYALVVDPQTSYTGTITLTLYDVPADLGGPIASDGSAVVLALGTPGQNARLTFDGLAGDRFAVKVGSGLSGSAYVSIVGPTGATVGSRTLVGTSGGLLDLRTLELSGRHELVVDPQGAATASLTVNLYAVPPDLSPAIVPGGPPVTISTTAPGQNARLTFEGTAGRAISLQLSNVSVASAYVSVLAPDGTALVKNTLLDNSGTFVDTKLLPASGTYSIVVDPTAANTGSVTLALYDVPADVSGELVVGGSPLAVSLGTPGQNARLTFQGTAGRRVSLVLSAVSISSSQVTILRPNGTTLAAVIVSPTGKTVTLDLNATGTYVVLLDPRAAATGGMTFRLS